MERVVGPVLIVSPFILGFADVAAARNFYILIGIIIILVGVFTDYQKTTS
ncbi:MAG: hypothetical protein ACXW0H_05495 [Methylobacter sp.]